MKPRNYYPLLSISVLAISMTSFWWQHIESTAATQQAELSQVGTITKVSDGDTVTIQIDGKQEATRLCGIDAPALNQPLGKAAKQALASMVQGKQVVFTPVGQDRYGRRVAEISILGEPEHFINADLVEAGMAYRYAQYSENCPNRGAIAQAEIIAKFKHVGVWQRPKR